MFSIGVLFFLMVKICAEDFYCEFKESCSECIQSYGCVWCTDPQKTKEVAQTHCFGEEVLKKSPNVCPPDKIVLPKSNFEVVEGKLLKSQKNGESIQIHPQKVKMSLRKGEEFTLKFQFRQAENYPIDLYYLMDLSASMEKHREKLANLGNELVQVMKNLTTDFRIGFGSFMDKVDMPFVSTEPNLLTNPCKFLKPDGREVHCVSPYSYKNHMSLTDDFMSFSREVEKAQVSGNLDSPEGTFDAIMQVMVCDSEIGWRKKTRHVLVVSTDAEFHIAGDGKLAGIVEPNDGECHLVNNVYTDYLNYDYPSISHINHVAKKKNINLIFAIVHNAKNVTHLYKKLQDRIENSVTGVLTQDSSNVVSLVLDNYHKIAESVTMKDDSGKGVEIKYNSFCPFPKENGCLNVRVGEVINFDAVIRPLECHTEPQIINIKPEGIDESLRVELNTLCECNCESFSKSENCFKQGDFTCGVCKCYTGYYGKNCECDKNVTVAGDLSICKRNSSEEVCSGLGECVCGECHCSERPDRNQRIYGKYCECDNFSCKRSNGQICSGTDNGVCECGVCSCLSGWTGDACECSESTHSCYSPNFKDSVCSGRGDCRCGRCNCQEIGGRRYSGQFCEECPLCPGQRCDEFAPCVQCYQNNMENHKTIDCNCSFTIEFVEKIDENLTKEEIKVCRTLDDAGCASIFQYRYNEEKNIVLKIQRKKKCPEKVNALVVSLSVIGSVLLAGIIMLIVWKVYAMVHDRREYQKFESERCRAKWHKNENPLHKKACSEFKNPTFGKHYKNSN